MHTPTLRVLAQADLEKIHQAALRILDEVGMLIELPAALDILESAGARVDHATSRVYFPPTLVEASRARIPKRYTYHGRTPDFDRVSEIGGDIFGRPPGGCPDYVEILTGNHRPARTADWREFCTLVDALPNIGALGNQTTGDVPARTADVHSMRVMLEAQRKCAVHGASSVEGLQYQIELMLAVRGTREALAERPLVHNMVSPINPLYHDADNAAQILRSVDYGLPLDIAVMSIVGVTSPATLAGSLAQNLAEELGTITLIQAARPGHPCAFFVDPVVGNMRTGEAMMGAPESALLIGAICQLGTELFGVPTEAIGFNTDGFSSAQQMFQKAQNLAFQVLSGGTVVVGAGCIESIMALSPVQLVLDDEFLAIARRWLRGIPVSDETLAVEVVRRVGPRGDYLSDDHTIDAIHAGELVDLELAERESRRAVWELRGSKTLESRAADKARRILGSHEVPPLPDEVLREMAEITRTADRQLAGI
jgi:trimethylamine---corrinoid protein Co-methyltransferase